MKKEEIFRNVHQLIQDNKLYHSIIISHERQEVIDETAMEIARQMFCEKKSLINDGCKWCLKVRGYNNLNISYIGNGVDQIAKKEIQELILRFSSTSLEDNKNKLYIIKNAEDMNEFAANSLLKFLEEPPNNTYAILLTRDKNRILSTIKSRCKILNISLIETKIKQKSQLLDFIIQKDKINLLLYLIEFKKKEKPEIIEILESTFQEVLNLEPKKIQEILLDSIYEIKSTNYISLILENLFIKIYEVI